MLGELGQLALCFALALSLVMAVAGLVGAPGDTPNSDLARRIASASALGLMVFVVLSFGTLVTAFVTSDFSIADVANNSHTLKPLIYKITGVWGNHEGSMLLWVLVLSLYAGAVAGLQRGGARLTSAALGVQGLLAAAFILFIAFTSLSTAPIVMVKMFATGLAAGIIVDATVIRMLLVPALLSLFGRWNWWLPAGFASILRVQPSPLTPRWFEVPGEPALVPADGADEQEERTA